MILERIVLNPVILTKVTQLSQAAKETIAQDVTSGHYIYDIMMDYAMPLVWDFGKVLLVVGIIRGIYMLMNTDVKGFVNKTKWATTGYIILRFIQVFTSMIDGMADGIVQKMIGG